MIGASVSEYGAMWAQDHLRRSLGIAGRARAASRAAGRARRQERFDEDGELVDRELRDRLAEIVGALVDHSRRLATGGVG